MLEKCIEIVDQNGFPAPDVYVIPESLGNETWTNFEGKAKVKANTLEEKILIKSVTGQEVSYQFKNLPKKIVLEANTLDEVVITAKPKQKKKTALWLLLGGVASLFLFSGSSTPKKVKL